MPLQWPGVYCLSAEEEAVADAAFKAAGRSAAGLEELQLCGLEFAIRCAGEHAEGPASHFRGQERRAWQPGLAHFFASVGSRCKSAPATASAPPHLPGAPQRVHRRGLLRQGVPGRGRRLRRRGAEARGAALPLGVVSAAQRSGRQG